MPPPPTVMTTVPLSTSALTVFFSMTSIGRGRERPDGSRGRHPRPWCSPFPRRCGRRSPCRRTRRRAWSDAGKRGQPRRRAPASRRSRRPCSCRGRRARCRWRSAGGSRYSPWLIAPHSGKGMSDLMASASAAVAMPRLIMPTCGPLPWAMMTSLPCAIRSTMGFAVSVTRASCS